MKKYSPDWWQSLPPERVGKETETLIENLFSDWNSSQNFAWHRMPDAKAARGRVSAQPADFMYRHGKFSGFLEVKALKHAKLLPSGRVTQLPTLRKWSLAGSNDVILVFQYLEDKWRVMFPDELDPSVPSWDISGVKSFSTPGDALISTGYF